MNPPYKWLSFLIYIEIPFVTFMVNICYIYGESDYYMYGYNSITFMVSHLLHLWLMFITWMDGITFMNDFYYIYGEYYICGCYYIYG